MFIERAADSPCMQPVVPFGPLDVAVLMLVANRHPDARQEMCHDSCEACPAPRGSMNSVDHQLAGKWLLRSYRFISSLAAARREHAYLGADRHRVQLLQRLPERSSVRTVMLHRRRYKRSSPPSAHSLRPFLHIHPFTQSHIVTYHQSLHLPIAPT